MMDRDPATYESWIDWAREFREGIARRQDLFPIAGDSSDQNPSGGLLLPWYSEGALPSAAQNGILIWVRTATSGYIMYSKNGAWVALTTP